MEKLSYCETCVGYIMQDDIVHKSFCPLCNTVLQQKIRHAWEPVVDIKASRRAGEVQRSWDIDNNVNIAMDYLQQQWLRYAQSSQFINRTQSEKQALSQQSLS